MNCDKVSASAGASAKPMLRNEQPYERLHTVYITCDNQRFFPCNVSVLIFLARRLSVQTDQLCRLIVHSVYSFRSIDILARSADTGPCYHPRERIKSAEPHCYLHAQYIPLRKLKCTPHFDYSAHWLRSHGEHHRRQRQRWTRIGGRSRTTAEPSGWSTTGWSTTGWSTAS